MGLFSEKPAIELGIGDFEFKFFYHENDLRGTRLEISTTSGVFTLIVGGNTHTYGYLLESARQNNTDALHGYAVMVYFTAGTLTGSESFCQELARIIGKHIRRLDKAAQSAAESVTDTDNAVAETLLSDINREDFKQEMRDSLREGLVYERAGE